MELEELIKPFIDELEAASAKACFDQYGRYLECGMTDVKNSFEDLFLDIKCVIDQLND
jgi:hypothetical protein